MSPPPCPVQPSRRFAGAALLLALAMHASAADQPAISFRRDIAPLLQRRCAACHCEDSAKGGYRLDTFKRLSKAGESDLAPLVAGQPDSSELYQLLVEPDAHDRMPQRAEALPDAEIALVKRWIAEGAPYDGGAPERPLTELVRETLLRPAPEHYARPMPVTALAFDPHGARLAVSGYYEVTLWDVESGQLLRRIGGLPERITSLAWNAKRNLLAVAGGSPAQWGAVWLINPKDDWKPRILCDLSETALAVAFSPDGASLVAGAGDRTIRQFDTTNGRQTRLWKSHADWVQTISFSSDGTVFLAASRDRTARVYDNATGDPLVRYDGHEAPVIAAVFPPRPSSAFSVARGQFVQQWETTKGKLIAEFTNAGRAIQVLLPMDSNFLTGGSDGVVQLVQPSDREVVMTFYGHHDAIESLALAPDHRTFASGDHSGVICVCNTGCESPIRTFIAQP